LPTPKLSDDELIAALNLVEEYGSIHNAIQAGVIVTAHRNTLDRRAEQGRLRGLKPTFRKDAPRIYSRQRLGRMHIVIPDVQCKPGVKLDHLTWVGKYIAEKQPDVIVCIGDFADMESLSKYDVGTIRGENKRLKRDLQTARTAMELLMQPIRAVDGYCPELHLTMGNHEERLDRFANEHPYLEEVVGTHMLNYEEWGWKVHPFLKPVEIDGVQYCHYFVTGDSGRPVTSAPALLRRRHKSAIMGHAQKTDISFHPVTHQWAIFCGICNLHDEPFLGPQGNLVRRQILVLHEVDEGKFDPMFVSLNFLKKSYN
jgi:hypothetical protein